MCDDLDALWAVRDGEPLDETIARHAELRDLLATLHVYERELGNDEAVRLADHVEPGQTYVTAHGIPAHWGYPKNEKWAGARLLRHLTVDYIDPTDGDFKAVVPLRTLVDVLPAVDDEGATSSKWKKAGLKKHGIDAREFLTVEQGPPRASIGKGHRVGVFGPGART